MKKIEGGGSRKNSLVIEKIKEQYQENINTIKMMIEQEVKEAIEVVEDACRAMNYQIEELEGRIEYLEKQLNDKKIHTHKQNNSRQEDSPLASKRFKDSVSDIFGVSIPEEEW